APALGGRMADVISVLIADDHPFVRHGLRTYLETLDDMEVAGEASDGAEAVELVERLLPDVVLMDLVMPELDGVGATRRIRVVSEKTVKTHVSNILAKLHLADRTQAALYAVREGLAELDR